MAPGADLDLATLGSLGNAFTFDASKADAFTFARVAGPALAMPWHASRPHPLYGVAWGTGAVQEAQQRLLGPLAQPFPGVHAGSSYRIHRQVSFPQTITTRGAPIAIYPTSAGTAVEVLLQSFDENGLLIFEEVNTAIAVGQEWTSTIHGVRSSRETPQASPTAHEWTSVTSLPRDAPRQFSAVQRNDHPLHYDADYARKAGFDGIIAHGSHILSLAAAELVAATDDRASKHHLTAFGGRFGHPAIPGALLRCHFRAVGPGTWMFEVVGATGRSLVKNGFATTGPVHPPWADLLSATGD